ncbi:hypothetical protein PIB30_018622 [Stylosanthes scabra]|uniref:Uncharacterized protein n=1 Tax=Stylosanthes scabra TaxID=79078 RepID=A0ABU6T7R8_9FABA|nr:hypothetical protein [Stylosanthes scabra]
MTSGGIPHYLLPHLQPPAAKPDGNPWMLLRHNLFSLRTLLLRIQFPRDEDPLALQIPAGLQSYGRKIHARTEV